MGTRSPFEYLCKPVWFGGVLGWIKEHRCSCTMSKRAWSRRRRRQWARPVSVVESKLFRALPPNMNVRIGNLQICAAFLFTICYRLVTVNSTEKLEGVFQPAPVCRRLSKIKFQGNSHCLPSSSSL